MKDCIFCRDSIQHAVFASSANFLAIYNIAPIAPGHSLIIPKKHFESMLQLPDNELCEMTVFAKKVSQLLIHTFKSDGFNWSIQDREAAGQTIAHLHMHVLPRQQNDFAEAGDWYPKIKDNLKEILDSQSRPKLSSSQMQTIIEHLRAEAVQTGLF